MTDLFFSKKMSKDPKGVMMKSYQDLETMITDLNLAAIDVEKEDKEKAEFLREVAEDAFAILKKVAGKMEGCEGCGGGSCEGCDETGSCCG